MILINGDSWTGGPTYENLEDTWPHQLSKKYNLPVTNLAWGGASNQRIFRTTIEYLYTCEELPTHLIIGWSSKERFELPSTAGFYMRITPNNSCDKFIETNKEVPGIESVKENFYRYILNNNLISKSFVNNILMLQDLCKLKGIKLLNFNSRWPDDKLFENKKVDQSSWILPANDCMGSYLSLLKFGSIITRHTTVKGQQCWADVVYNCL
jgi:hypothetical protein